MKTRKLLLRTVVLCDIACTYHLLKYSLETSLVHVDRSCHWLYKDLQISVCLSLFFVEFQEDSVKTGKVTSAGMYFLHFQVYRLDPTVNAVGCLDLLSYSVQELLQAVLSRIIF